jgi:hypothetical protein
VLNNQKLRLPARRAVVAAFNARAASPTRWVVHLHGDADAAAQVMMSSCRVI